MALIEILKFENQTLSKVCEIDTGVSASVTSFDVRNDVVIFTQKNTLYKYDLQGNLLAHVTFSKDVFACFLTDDLVAIGYGNTIEVRDIYFTELTSATTAGTVENIERISEDHFAVYQGGNISVYKYDGAINHVVDQSLANVNGLVNLIDNYLAVTVVNNLYIYYFDENAGSLVEKVSKTIGARISDISSSDDMSLIIISRQDGYVELYKFDGSNLSLLHSEKVSGDLAGCDYVLYSPQQVHDV